MKKMVCIIIVIVICGCLLVGLVKDNTFDGNIKSKIEFDKQSSVEVPPVLQAKNYLSIDGFLHDFVNDIAYCDSSEMKGNENSDVFSSFSSNRLNDNSIYIPWLNNSLVDLRQEEGYPAISFFYEEAYAQPWIWYFLKTEDGSNAYIKIMYLDTVLEGKEISEANSRGVEWTINKISPKSRSASSTQDSIVSASRTISLKEKNVISKKAVTKNDARVKVQFVYDEILVVICAKPELLTDDWFSGLEFKKVQF